MKYAPSIYARAFLDAKPDIKRFLTIVAKNGDSARIDQIVAAIEELATKEAKGSMVTLEVAREVPELVEKLQKQFKAKDQVRVKINPNLVAGVRITINGEQELDMSLKRKLNKLFS